MSLLLNICKYNNCGLVFPNLGQLIQHIEKKHINFDAEYVEKLETAKPAALPLSYVLPSNIELGENDDSEELKRPSSSALTDSEQQNFTLAPISDDTFISESADGNSEDEIEPEDTFIFDFIMRYGSERSTNQFDDKPFVCPMPDCTKRYKNVSGLRYHAKNGHKNNNKPAKKYECYCGRGYKTVQGLRAHAIAVHQIELILPSSSSVPQSEDTLSLLTLANMPNVAFDEIHDFNVSDNTHELTSAEGDVEAVFNSAMGFTDGTCLEVSADLNLIKTEPNSDLECSSVDHLECVSNIKPAKIECNESSLTSSGSVRQETLDADEKTIHVKSEPLDDDEIDVGNANDAVYPYYH